MSRRAKELIGTVVPDRWMAELFYRGEDKPRLVLLEELEDLDELVERGPDWNTIDRIVITLNRPSVEPVKESQ
ncbi:hypothetical protein [Bradyrhizobium sp. Ai1a-2]|uniref:hypothetical protein n=1 Tax=Bradyrhizobium sp. Ai1a-2 TaxID=196490 RepID=UPI001268EC09|nr:hypothetical protein [Bradyrhizobium sp. Ai1a-2]